MFFDLFGGAVGKVLSKNSTRFFFSNLLHLSYLQGYVIGAGVTMQVVAPPFGKLMSTEQQLEGEYRQLHSRLRTHSESIAFYGGQDREASIITQRFRSIIGSAYSILANIIVKIVLRVLQDQPYESNVVIFSW